MKSDFQHIITAALVLVVSCISAIAITVERGVSRELAQYRSDHISDVRYSLSFTVPTAKDKPVAFFETLRFKWRGEEDLQVDFQGDVSQLDGCVMVNGKNVNTELIQEHIIIPSRYLKLGENRLSIGGYCGDQALNRHDDYMYTLFVPDHARSVFPCFDQPDLKARFDVELELPEGWVSITNDTQHPIPTYLFSFTAGRFQVETAMRDGRTLTALYRETDPDKVSQMSTVFDQVALSLRWMEQYTNLEYPFEKYGFVILPGYQFGGMEHPGCIQFTDHEIFLGEHPTADEQLTRLNLIAHETAHMWFGDLVTMRWFDDVWTKEVFANFMADKISRQQFPDINHDLAFIKAHYPMAMNTDRTQGSHPIQQHLANLNQAGLLYGNIIYHKAPIMMRKLEQEKGTINLRQGLRSYLLHYAYGNASWDDLIAELDRFAPEHSARAFSDVWVKQKGAPTVTCEQQDDGTALVMQHDPYGRGLSWKQGFEIGFYSAGKQVSYQYQFMNHDRLAIDVPAGTVPVLNVGGDGYGRFELGDKEIRMLSASLSSMPDEMNRYAAILNLYENYHMGRVSAPDLFECFVSCLAREHNELIASTLCTDIFSLLPSLDRDSRYSAEQQLMQLVDNHDLKSVSQTLLRHLSTTAVEPSVVNRLCMLWADGTPLLNDRDCMSMSYHLAIMLPEQWQSVLEKQRSRLKTEDQRREFDFVSRACTPDTVEQQQLFDSLLDAANRRVEPWVRKMLALLNDPEREPWSNRYLKPGLDEIVEIQRTGDIFFPGYWLSSLLGGHRSDEARHIVRTWIESHGSLSPALMNKVKENAYWLLDR